MPDRSALEAIAGRQSAHRFDPDRPLSEALLVQLLDLATRAPSGFELQPWRFVVVRSVRNRRRLRACAGGDARLTDAPVVLLVLAYHHPHRTDLETVLAQGLSRGSWTSSEAAEIRARAPRIIESKGGGAVWSVGWAMAAAATLVIAAEALGIASATIEAFDLDRLGRAFGIPADHSACLLVPLGHAAEEGSRPAPGKLPMDRVCFEEHFGQPWTLGEPG